MITFIDRAVRETNKSKSFLNRKFKYTTLELICYALYLAMGVAIGAMIVISSYSTDIWLLTLVGLVAGFLLSTDFLLLVNHILSEAFQTVNMNHETGIVSVRRFGKTTIILLEDPNTFHFHYVARWRKSYGKGFKFFGANFSKTVIQNGDFKIQLSGLRRQHFYFSKWVNSKNIRIVKRQINFII
ncbi:hypothetical protein LPB86_12665 [Pedobacter sp. MC2016-14]|uniref:hypothetical protein n=1 Tax=Pedobacter sp. MC2016-14 TaxID=2897327 RepID=UPI001E3B45EC|nr:hypothetical protein [Pedobacter sp. MC2016-14]MCD0489085.1 hypothetical protein [Pedobacter sp. MC2016-14]